MFKLTRTGCCLPLLAAAVAALLVPAAAPAAESNCSVTNDPVCVRAVISGTMSARGSYKPVIVTIEYTVPVVHIKWSSWTLTRAVGRGRLAKCGSCRPITGYDYGAAVTIVLQRPKEYFCGEEPESIGTWFTRAQVTSKVLGSHLYKIIGEGHPNPRRGLRRPPLREASRRRRRPRSREPSCRTAYTARWAR